MRKTLAIVALILTISLSARGQGATQNVITNFSPAASGGPWAFDAKGVNNVCSTGCSGTFTVTTTGGDTIVAGASSYSLTSGQAVTSITVSGGACGSAFTKIVSQTFTGGYDAEIWAAPNCPASTTITLNFSGGGQMGFGAVAIKNMPMTIITDGTNTSSGASSGSPVSGPSITPTKTGDFIFSTFDPQHLVTSVASGWTLINVSSVGNGYLNSNSAPSGTAQAPSWTLSASGGYAAASAAFATH